MKQGKKLTREQKVLIDKVKLYPSDWLCIFEDKNYLHIVQRDKSPAEVKIIDKVKRKVLEPGKQSGLIKNTRSDYITGGKKYAT